MTLFMREQLQRIRGERRHTVLVSHDLEEACICRTASCCCRASGRRGGIRALQRAASTHARDNVGTRLHQHQGALCSRCFSARYAKDELQ